MSPDNISLEAAKVRAVDARNPTGKGKDARLSSNSPTSTEDSSYNSRRSQTSDQIHRIRPGLPMVARSGTKIANLQRRNYRSHYPSTLHRQQRNLARTWYLLLRLSRNSLPTRQPPHPITSCWFRGKRFLHRVQLRNVREGTACNNQGLQKMETRTRWCHTSNHRLIRPQKPRIYHKHQTCKPKSGKMVRIPLMIELQNFNPSRKTKQQTECSNQEFRSSAWRRGWKATTTQKPDGIEKRESRP